MINVLKIICSLPFYKPVYIFGANSSHISYTELQALPAVYPLKRIFKLNTFCVSDFKFTTRAISENPRRLSTILKSNCHHTWIEEWTVLNQGWQPLKQIDLDQKQFDLESIIFPEYFKRWELGLTLAFITESSFQHIPMCISSYFYSNFRLIKNNFLFLETYIIISHSLVHFLEVDEHFLEMW